MKHKVKIFLYYHSFYILFKKYRNQWFNNQLQELIIETLKDMPQEFLEGVFCNEKTR